MVWEVDVVLTQAASLVETRGLRALDAIQLASALDLKRYIASSDSLLFVACDTRLLEAAATEHLPTWNPELTAAP